ncbi:DUF1573 domain-containing protein [Puniceicoccus vermicola]|uniref:DUF1573 domain-containing protein n=2 Tax=Puniceicoccus vermicola TaxID=388746 RepID=A0A7X1AVQ0_9BACT|nr:DUF1573 domain-containing protein [Puniceicoccus vermicola]
MDLDAQPEWEKTQRFETVLKGVPSVDQRFSFVNKGDEPLVIESVKPSCGCVVPEYSQQPIPAGGTGYVKVVFKPGERVGLQRETIRVSFEGNKEFSQTLVLRIDVQEKVEIHPQMVHWIRGDDFTPREINYQIHESLSWKLKSVKMEGDAFSVDHTVLSEDDFRKGVITVNRLKSGEHREEVLLVFTEAESSGGEGENAPEDVERKLIVRSLR